MLKTVITFEQEGIFHEKTKEDAIKVFKNDYPDAKIIKIETNE